MLYISQLGRYKGQHVFCFCVDIGYVMLTEALHYDHKYIFYLYMNVHVLQEVVAQILIFKQCLFIFLF